MIVWPTAIRAHKKPIVLPIVSSVQCKTFGSNVYVNWTKLPGCLVRILINFCWSLSHDLFGSGVVELQRQKQITSKQNSYFSSLLFYERAVKGAQKVVRFLDPFI